MDKVSLIQPLSAYPEWFVNHLKKRVLDNENRKQKNSFLQKIKMISAEVGALKRPAEGILIFGEKNVCLLWFPLLSPFPSTSSFAPTSPESPEYPAPTEIKK